MAKRHSVEIHGHNLLLRVVVLQLGSGNPFLEFAQHKFRGNKEPIFFDFDDDWEECKDVYEQIQIALDAANIITD